jgi:Spy/CpxP family protein refolding chaperone
MTKAKILLVLAYVVVCAAGVVVGTAVDWHVHPAAVPPPRGPFDPLHLSTEQEAQVRAVWEPVAQDRGKMFHQRHEAEDRRSDAIQKLFTPEQKQQYDQIQKDFHRQTKELEDQLSTDVAKATQQMQLVLTPEQFKVWNDLRKDHGFGHDKHGPGMGSPGMGGPPPMGAPGMGPPPGMGLSRGHRHHPSTRPSTDPTTDPA